MTLSFYQKMTIKSSVSANIQYIKEIEEREAGSFLPLCTLLLYCLLSQTVKFYGHAALLVRRVIFMNKAF